MSDETTERDATALGAAVDLQLKTRGFVRTRDVVRATGRSRQAVVRHLKQRVLQGELVRSGHARAMRYSRGSSALRRLPDSLALWLDLMNRVCDFRYLHLATRLDRFDRPSDAHRIWRQLNRAQFVVFDFEGVPSASEPFLRALLFDTSGLNSSRIAAINFGARLQSQASRASTNASLFPDLFLG